LSDLIVLCATLRAATPRWQGFRTCLIGLLCRRQHPAYPARVAAGAPRVYSWFFVFFWTRNFGLIDQIINAIEFLTDEEDVDVADETLGWE
jgi:hypothetical protein